MTTSAHVPLRRVPLGVLLRCYPWGPQQVARDVGISRTTIYKLLSGRHLRQPDGLFERLAALYKKAHVTYFGDPITAEVLQRSWSDVRAGRLTKSQ